MTITHKEQDAARRNAWAGGNLVPDKIAAQESTKNTKIKKLATLPAGHRICNSSMPRHDHYYTGYGEIIQPVRPGADDHMQHPSRFPEWRTWVNGRVEHSLGDRA